MSNNHLRREKTDSPLPWGAYDALITQAIERNLKGLQPGLRHNASSLSLEELPEAVAEYAGRIVKRIVEDKIATGELAGSGTGDNKLDGRSLFERIALGLREALEADIEPPVTPALRLLEVCGDLEAPLVRPDIPLRRSTVLTGSRADPSLMSQLEKELATADRVEILCSFILWSGLRMLLPALRDFTARANGADPVLRVITTSYMGATQARAVEALAKLPRTEVKISYDTHRTRLHAKAYLFHRNSGFSSAYVGSANMSQAALLDGLEWTTKVSEAELPHVWARVIATFDSLWHDAEFVRYVEADRDRLIAALQAEKARNTTEVAIPLFELQPYQYQQEILHSLQLERADGRPARHLVVAATGTGKTMIAAFDYRNWRASTAGSSRLLFIAHRKEILEQAMYTFRAVLRDPNFGELCVDGMRPSQNDHVFCSIQSYVSGGFAASLRDRFDYVVVDEFHHAAAESYQALLESTNAQVLLGLTATPERADGQSVLHHFGGRFSAEIRLPDAINRRLLCPFQYFGVTDHQSVDLTKIGWSNGKYDAAQLGEMLNGNTARANLVVERLAQYVTSPSRMRALVFCAGVNHARFTAEHFNHHGIRAVCVHGGSSSEERAGAIRALAAGDLNAICAADLFNEGIDIPSVDTVVFLRPTESLTVFLQQLGRGLRLSEGKDCLTVLDFVAHHSKRFRFGDRLRALSVDPSINLEREVRASFPHLPSGCGMQFERVAMERVLANIRDNLLDRRKALVGALAQLGPHAGDPPSVAKIADALGVGLRQLFRFGPLHGLLADAGLRPPVDEADAKLLADGIVRIAHHDDPQLLECALRTLDGEGRELHGIDAVRRDMFLSTLFGRKLGPIEPQLATLSANPITAAEVRQAVEFLRDRAPLAEHRPAIAPFCPLAAHRHYSAAEVAIATGFWNATQQSPVTSGAVHVKNHKLDLFFVSIQKSEDHYSDSHLFEDYAIDMNFFHWQSQNATSPESVVGQRYIRHAEMGYTPLLFARPRKFVEGSTAAYRFLGPLSYVSHTGSRPMSVRWRLAWPLPPGQVRELSIAN